MFYLLDERSCFVSSGIVLVVGAMFGELSSGNENLGSIVAPEPGRAVEGGGSSFS